MAETQEYDPNLDAEASVEPAGVPDAPPDEAPSWVGGTDSSGEPGLDELLDAPANYDDVRQVESDALLPAGSYSTIPPLTRTLSRTERGRPVIRFFGGIVQRKRDPVSKELVEGARGSIGFAMSTMRVNKVKNGVQTGEPDNPTKLYAAAARAYEQATGARAQSVAEIVEFVEQIPLRLRVIQIGTRGDSIGEPGNLVVGITAIREE